MTRVPPRAGVRHWSSIFPLLLGALLLLPSLSSAAGSTVRVRLANGKTMEALAGQVIVRYRGEPSSAVRTRVARRFGAQTRGSIDRLNMAVLSVPAGDTIESFIAKLKTDPDVVYAEPNGIVRAVATAMDPRYSTQNYLQTINIESAWDVTQGVPSVVVAVLDTGIDEQHDDIDGKIISANSARIEIDWDGDGVCNPVIDFNSIGAGPDQCAAAGPGSFDDDNDRDENGNPADIYHGTRVSGLVAAETNNGINVAGTAPNVSLIGVKVLNRWGAGSYGAVAEGIVHAINNGAHVINMSLGGGDPQNGESQAVRDAVNAAIAANIVVVAASGNGLAGCAVNFPASITDVIAVGATTDSHGLASFSCLGPELDLVAPGVTIRSILPDDTDDEIESGTSFSAPLVAGVAALIKSLNPNFTSREVTDFINFTATDLGAAEFDNSFGFGELNAAAAVRAANGDTDFTQPKTYPYPNPFRPRNGSVRFVPPISLGSENPEIKIYTVSGELVKELSNTLVWDGRNDDGNTIASGLYFYHLKTSRGDVVGKLTVIK